LTVLGYQIFRDVNLSTVTLHVPTGTKSLYEAANVWKEFGTIKDDVNLPITVVPDKTQPVGSDGNGTITRNLSLLSDATLTGSFDIQFPAGIKLNEDLTILSSELSKNFIRTITAQVFRISQQKQIHT